MTALLLVTLAAAMTAGIKQDLKTLRTSHVRQEVVEAAVRIAGGGDPIALRQLGDLLTTQELLARLDVLDDPQRSITNLSYVLGALTAHPTEATGRLCETLATNPVFLADDDRMLFLLPALAAVRPMTTGAEAVFRATNADGFFNSNGPLLAANGSERAVALLESMFADRSQRVDERASMAHEAILPNRTNVAIVRMVDRLWERPVEMEVLRALAESIFEYNPEWYGKRRNPPVAPDWSTAPREARQAAAALGRKLSNRADLPASVRAAIQAATKSSTP
jgi:hypothetical protein